MTDIKHPLPEGTIVRVARFQESVEVSEYVPVEEADDGKPFYLLSSEYGYCNVDRDEGEILEVVATPEEAQAKRVPTRKQVAELLGRLCGEETDDLEIDEVDWSDERAVVLFGENEHGRRFAVTIPMDAVRIAETDF